MQSENGTYDLKELKSLYMQDSFGEMALLSEKNVRSATIVAKVSTVLAVLKKEDFL
jgi:CRP-like cAMP-binding protein